MCDSSHEYEMLFISGYQEIRICGLHSMKDNEECNQWINSVDLRDEDMREKKIHDVVIILFQLSDCTDSGLFS